MGDKYNIFLEIQRGGWESRKALQQKQLNIKKFNASVNAFGLIKVYASAWLNEPGLAFRTTPPFVPGGKIFKQITEDKNFCIDDLYAAYCLYKTAEKTANIRPVKNPKRSRYLYYYVIAEFLRRIMRASSGLEPSLNNVSNAIIYLFDVRKSQSEGTQLLLETATLLDDDYFNKNGENSIFKEPTFNGDLNNHLGHFEVSKASQLQTLLSFHWNDLRRKSGNQPSRLDMIAAALEE